jgi:hypothetical protein
VTSQSRESVHVGTSFAVWPPPTVSQVDPLDFGIHTGADRPGGRRLNPYVRRELDRDLEVALRDEGAVVVSAPRGAGTARTVYEVLKRAHPRARLLVPARPGEFASEILLATNLDVATILWLDKLGSYWSVEGSRLIEILTRWLHQPDRWLVASAYDEDPDVLASKEFEQLNARVLRLNSDLTSTELDRMRGLYGDVPTTTSIGFYPPARRAQRKPESEPSPESELSPEPAEREHVRLLDDEPVGLAEDQLGRKAVAKALKEQLHEHVQSFPGRSLFVHIDGAWGAGKSSLLRFLRESIDESWLVVPYDAWRQSRGGPPWLTLLQAVRSGVRSSYAHATGRAWFWLRERVRLIGTRQWVALLLMTLLVAAIVVLLVRSDLDIALSKWGDVAKLVGGLLPVVGALWLLAKSAGNFVSLDSRRSALTFLETRADPMEDLAAHFSWLLSNLRGPVVLLLIDDLDRCPETFVIDLLDSVQKLIRENGRGKADPSLLVVVAADGRWVRSSYDNAYSSLAEAVHEPGATVGTLFLEKLFQITFPLPRLPDELKEEYLRTLLAEESADGDRRSTDAVLERRLAEASREEARDVLAQASVLDRIRVSETAINKLVVEPGAKESTKHALEPYANLLDPTPRAMKRFVMAYSMLQAVRLAEGSVVGIGPLALWTIVLNRWPVLGSFLQSTPEAVQLFDASPERVAAGVPATLVPLFTDPPADLCAVMNHPDGPLNARIIAEASGQLLGGVGGP